MADHVIALRADVRLDAIEQRYFFAAWPQAFVHSTWMDLLDRAVGLKLSRRFGACIGLPEEAVAQALLSQVGVVRAARFAVDQVPTWAMRTHAAMRRHLSTVAALSVVPALKLTVSGAQARQWDEVLGAGVRQHALKLCQTDPHLLPPPQAPGFLQSGPSASKTPHDWEQFCLSLALAALMQLGSAVCARVRLAWPVAYRLVEPLAVNEAEQSWLGAVCMKVAQRLPEEQTLVELAA